MRFNSFFLCISSCAAFLLLRQKPLSQPGLPPLGRPQLWAVSRHAVASLLTSLAWFYGLTLCGPLRTVLATEHSPAAVLAGIAALFCGGGGGAQAKSRGAVLYILGTLALLLVDHDDNSPHHQVGQYSRNFKHFEDEPLVLVKIGGP